MVPDPESFPSLTELLLEWIHLLSPAEVERVIAGCTAELRRRAGIEPPA